VQLSSYDCEAWNSTSCCHTSLFSCVLGCFNACVSVIVFVIVLRSRSQVPKYATLDAWMIKDGSVLGCVLPSVHVDLIVPCSVVELVVVIVLQTAVNLGLICQFVICI
jgi:hypothetical protein